MKIDIPALLGTEYECENCTDTTTDRYEFNIGYRRRGQLDLFLPGDYNIELEFYTRDHVICDDCLAEFHAEQLTEHAEGIAQHLFGDDAGVDQVGSGLFAVDPNQHFEGEQIDIEDIGLGDLDLDPDPDDDQ